MPAQYLLPCSSCQQQRTIDATDCGLMVECACGAKLKVPPMRGLSKLQRLASAEPRKRNRWGAREGMILAGAVLAIVGIGLGAYGYSIPDTTSQEFVERAMGPRPDLDQMNPLQVVEEWGRVMGSGLGEYNPQIGIEYEKENRVKHIWTWAALGLGGLGLVLVATAFFVAAPRRP